MVTQPGPWLSDLNMHASLSNFTKFIPDDIAFLRPNRYYTGIILLHYYIVDLVSVLNVKQCQPIPVSPPWHLILWE